MSIIIPVLGIIVLMAIAYAISSNRKAVNWRTIAWAAGLQIAFALVILKTKAGKIFFEFMNNIILAVLDCQRAGAIMVFGDLADNSKFGYIFAFQVVPTIIFFSALMSLLYYLGIMQKIVKAFSWLMEKTCKTSGAESLSAAANIFVGQTEAPLLIRPYVDKMTRSELMCVMTGGMATVAGGVMAAYIIMLRDSIPGIAGHLMAASMMGAPAAIMFAKLIIPETEATQTKNSANLEYKDPSENVLDAISSGTTTGLQLALNVAAMLIAFVAIIALLNGGLSWITGFFMNFGDNMAALGAWVAGTQEESGLKIIITGGVTFEQLLGWVLAPFTFLMGVPWSEAQTAGRLIAEKTVINEFFAYANFAEMLNNGTQLSAKTKIILSYALCGFANFGSIGIQIGGIGAIAPKRRAELSKIGIYALIAGLMATCFRAIIAGMLS